MKMCSGKCKTKSNDHDKLKHKIEKLPVLDPMALKMIPPPGIQIYIFLRASSILCPKK